MKKSSKQFGKKTAFTIIELLTVMAIIAILIGLLVPSLRAVRRQARKVKQKTQLNALNTALEVFSDAYGGYPPSNLYDETGKSYGGAFKLAEAMVGQDLLGFDPRSHWRADLKEDDAATPFYYGRDRSERLDVFIELEHANAYKMGELYPSIGALYEELFVLCDVFRRVGNIGMPILYYKANTFNKSDDEPHDPNKHSAGNPSDFNTNIYNYYDCFDVVNLGIPPTGATKHPLADPTSTGQTLEGILRFYNQTHNPKVKIWSDALSRFVWWPYKAESFILISAGPDGLYGTRDDIHNFSY